MGDSSFGVELAVPLRDRLEAPVRASRDATGEATLNRLQAQSAQLAALEATDTSAALFARIGGA
jgi:hypothetical protein